MKRITVRGVVLLCAAACTTAALAGSPIGLDAMKFDNIPMLRTDARTYQASSYDRTGGNGDTGNFIRYEGSEQVLMDVAGPGCVYRMWMTGIDVGGGMIRIYLDGETTPTVEMTLGDFFSGTQAPFLSPLVENDNISSGGFICYHPIPFESGCKITTTGGGHYYNITYQKYPDATGITTFDGTADDSEIAAIWESTHTDPKADTGTSQISGTATIAAGDSLTLADIDSPGSIQGIELRLPGLEEFTQQTTIADDGRAFIGYSEFTVAIDPANNGVHLTRRLDYGIGDQKANVKVDGSLVGEWFTPGTAGSTAWLDSTFEIPGTETAGKSSITIRVEFVSAALDWNEFYYWVDSIVAGDPVQTDELDVGDTDDEAAHAYTVDGQTWEGANATSYYEDDGTSITDDGRATRDYVEFDMDISPANYGVRLVRRMDYTIADQKADVYVDDDYAGEWLTEGSIPAHFLEDPFEIPPALTTGKSSISIRIEFISSSNDWNEFYYWAYSHVGGSPVLSDELDVGDTASETAHSYYMHGPLWYGVRTFDLYTGETNAIEDILSVARVVGTWDDAASPQVDCPLGGLFGSHIGPARVNGLLGGMKDDMLYCWLPMPFANNAMLQIINDSDEDIIDLQYTIRYTPKTAADFEGLGHFYATFNELRPCILGEDYIILDVDGAGQFVGVSEARQGPGLGYLEGDERIHVDGSLTPALYGTGTEDFYNGGWYFNRGRFSLPTHGNPIMQEATGMYRYLVSDMIPFTTSLVVGIEHGATNNTTDTDIWSVALYYLQDEPLATLTDTLDVGDSASEASHAYSIVDQSWTGSSTFTYEGDDNDVDVTDDGRIHTSSSSFLATVDPDNAGVLLRRRMDYGIADQRATVVVEGTTVTTWYDAGENPFHRFRDSEIMIPASITAGKSEIDISMIVETPGDEWSEYHYWVYSLKSPAAALTPGDLNCDGVIDFGDINPFVAALSGQAGYESQYPDCEWMNADCNGDDLVDFQDINAFVALLSS